VLKLKIHKLLKMCQVVIQLTYEDKITQEGVKLEVFSIYETLLVS
jgi:hypothetical protein